MDENKAKMDKDRGAGVTIETLETMIELLKSDDKYRPSRELLLTILSELKVTKS